MLKYGMMAFAALAVGSIHAADRPIGPELQTAFVWSPTVKPGTQAYVAFRRGFSLAAKPSQAMLHVFADSRYILWINGRYVLRGPCRFDPKRPEYDSLEVSRYLRPGVNAVAILVHHYAGGGNSKIVAHEPGLTLALTLPDEAIHTNLSWRCSDRTGYLPSPAAWGSIPDVIDGRIEREDWTAADFDDSNWSSVARVDGTSWGPVQPRSLPLTREREVEGLKLLPGRGELSASLPLELTAGQEVIVDVGRMVMAYATVDLDADAASQLQIQYALRFVNGHPSESYGVGTTYTARAGRQAFTTGDEWGCHYLVLRCSAGRVKLHGLKITDRRYPFDRCGRFSCNDEFLNRLWEMAVNTIEVTTDDGYGADARERNEWLQDPAQPNYITTRVALAGPGTDGKPVYSEPRLLKNLLWHVSLSQTPDGRLKAHALSDRWDCHGYIEDYACQWVESLRMYYDATGDKEFVREMWPALAKQIQWFLERRTKRGLVLARQYTSFDDPLAYVTCEGTALNAFIYQAFRDSAYLGGAIDETGQASVYDAAAATLADSINQHLWNATEGTYNSGFAEDQLLGPTAHAALLALDRGVTPADRMPLVRQWFLANYHRPPTWHCAENRDFVKAVASRAGIGMPVTYYWVFQELYRMDSPVMDLEALQEMRRRWARMVTTSDDTGTLWEMFGRPESCHNYGSVPAYFLSAFVLGVRLDGPASNKRLLLEPRLGDLTRAEGVVVTEFGPVSESWKRDGKTLHFHFETPHGTTTTLRVPEGDAATLTLDGKQIPAESQGRYAVCRVGAGVHEGQIAVKSPPTPLPDPRVSERRISNDSSPVTIIARTDEMSPVGLEAEIVKDSSIQIASSSERGVMQEGGGANAEALYNGTTRNGSGTVETRNDGRTFRAYGTGSTLTLHLDVTRSPTGYDLTGLRTFAGHGDARASQSYTVFLAFAASPTKFVKLAEAAVTCDGGASELRMSMKTHGVVAIRFEFQDGPLGFNVYREINPIGQPSR